MTQSLRIAVSKARGVMVLIWALLAVNNLSVYVGGRSDSVQAMFSGLTTMARHNNHLFMPQIAIPGFGDYYLVSSVHIEGSTSKSEELTALQSFLGYVVDKRVLVYGQALRSAIRRICRDGGHVSLSVMSREGSQRTVENACEDPVLASENRWIPVSLHFPALPLDPVKRLNGAYFTPPDAGTR